MLLEDFYKEILKKLKVIAAEEEPSASDRLEAVNKYAQVFEEYDRRDLTTWFEDDDVPDYIADHFASMVAERLMTTFPVDVQTYTELQVASAKGETVLIADGQRRKVPSENPEYF